MRFIFLGNSNDKIGSSFQNYFTYLFDKELLFYCDTDYISFNENDCFFLIEPTDIQGKWYSVFPIWIDYLTINDLNPKVIIFHYSQKESLNLNPFFINIADNRRPFYKKLNSILSMGNLSIGDHNFCYDTAPITDILKDFFKGHGEESLVSVLTSIGNGLDMGPKLVLSDDYSVDECIQELIIKRELPRRWNEFKEGYGKYLAYFRYTPFFKEIQGLKDYFRKVDAYLQNIPKTKEAFIQARISEEIRKARVILEDIDRKYIGSERPIQL
jgi:hypothetical protein